MVKTIENAAAAAARTRRARWSSCAHYTRLLLTQLFSSAGLCFLTAAYCLLGAVIFEMIEAPMEVREKELVAQERAATAARLWELTLSLNVLYERNWTEAALRNLRDFELSVVRAVREKGYDGKEINATGMGPDAAADLQWSFSGSLLYSVTVITTIGYGNIAPKTDWGKIVTIGYALVGVPIMLLTMATLGNILAHTFRFSYKRLSVLFCFAARRIGSCLWCLCLWTCCCWRKCCCCCRPQKGEKNKEKPKPEADKSRKSRSISLERIASGLRHSTSFTADKPNEQREEESALMTDEPKSQEATPVHVAVPEPQGEAVSRKENRDEEIVQIEEEKEDKAEVGQRTSQDVPKLSYEEENRVPIFVVLIIVIGYIMAGAVMFSLWEGWTLLDGAYFVFITLSTIGFGDLVPGSARYTNDSVDEQKKFIVVLVYLLVGLTLLATSFSLVQQEIVLKFKDFGRWIGILPSAAATAASANSTAPKDRST